MWHVIDHIETSDSGEISTQVCVPSGSLWYSGHFPDAPILPGIAQLGIVYEAIRRDIGREFCLVGVRRIKFKKMIRPHESLNISITHKKDKEGTYAFQIHIGNDLACSGNLTLEKCDGIRDLEDRKI